MTARSASWPVNAEFWPILNGLSDLPFDENRRGRSSEAAVKSVHLRMVMGAFGTGVCRTSVDRLSGATGLKRRAVVNALHGIEAQGWGIRLEERPDGGAGNTGGTGREVPWAMTYLFGFPGAVPAAEPAVIDTVTRARDARVEERDPCTTCTGAVHEMHGTRAPGAPVNQHEPTRSVGGGGGSQGGAAGALPPAHLVAKGRPILAQADARLGAGTLSTVGAFADEVASEIGQRLEGGWTAERLLSAAIDGWPARPRNPMGLVRSRFLALPIEPPPTPVEPEATDAQYEDAQRRIVAPMTVLLRCEHQRPADDDGLHYRAMFAEVAEVIDPEAHASVSDGRGEIEPLDLTSSQLNHLVTLALEYAEECRTCR